MSGCAEVERLRVVGSKASLSKDSSIKALSSSIISLAGVLEKVCDMVSAGKLQLLIDDLEAAVNSADVVAASTALRKIRDFAAMYGRATLLRVALASIRLTAGVSLIIFAFVSLLTAVTPPQFELAPLILGLGVAASALYRRTEADALLIAASLALIFSGVYLSLVAGPLLAAAGVGSLTISFLGYRLSGRA